MCIVMRLSSHVKSGESFYSSLAEGVSYGVEPGGVPCLKNDGGPGRSPAPGFEETGPLPS